MHGTPVPEEAAVEEDDVGEAVVMAGDGERGGGSLRYVSALPVGDDDLVVALHEVHARCRTGDLGLGGPVGAPVQEPSDEALPDPRTHDRGRVRAA